MLENVREYIVGGLEEVENDYRGTIAFKGSSCHGAPNLKAKALMSGYTKLIWKDEILGESVVIGNG